MRAAMAFLLVSALAAALPVGGATDRDVPVSPDRAAKSAQVVPAAEGPIGPVEATVLATGFREPVEAVFPPDDERLFVVEKRGTIRIVEEGVPAESFFLDLRSIVDSDHVERGLLGLAFHPRFRDNGRFFVHYTGRDGDVHVVEYLAEGDRVDPATARRVLLVEQPQQFHNGGTLRFDPEGYLFIGLGDGGGIGDRYRNAQDPHTLLGSILRIDIDGPAPYSVPAANPFVAGGAAAEAWAYGLRNPWRFFIDPVERLIVIGDVGQSEEEEVDVLPLEGGAGSNLGWPILEGMHCYEEETCDPFGTVMPKLSYRHSQGCAVQGGPVYRGTAIPGLFGWIVYSDYCNGWVRAFRLEEGHLAGWDQLLPNGTFSRVLSLAVDPDGEILVLTAEGTIFRLQQLSSG